MLQTKFQYLIYLCCVSTFEVDFAPQNYCFFRQCYVSIGIFLFILAVAAVFSVTKINEIIVNIRTLIHTVGLLFLYFLRVCKTEKVYVDSILVAGEISSLIN